MTVELNDTVERYTVSGVGPYVFSFRIFAETDLQVTACSTATPAVPTLLTYLTHYTVSGTNDADGGEITLTAGVASTYAGYTLDIRTNTPQTQPTSIRNLGRFLPEIHEDAFDRLSRQVQDISRQVRASIRYPDNVLTDGTMTPLSAWLSKYLTINSTGLLEPAVLSSTAVTASIINALYSGSTSEQDALLALLMNRSDTAPALTSLVRTAAEISAGVTPVNYAYPPGDVRRYGADPTGVADSYAAITAAMSVFSNSGVVPFFPRGIYKLSAAITVPQGLFCNLGGALFKPTGSAGAFILSSAIWLTNGLIDMTSSSGGAIYASGDLQRLTLDSLEIVCGSGTGIELVNCYGVDAWNVRLFQGSGRAIYLRSTITSTPINSMRWEGIAASGFTGVTDIICLEGVAGIIFRNVDLENNASGATDFRITSNGIVSTTNVLVDGVYAETGPSLTGNIFKIDKGAGSAVLGVKLTRLYTLTSKQPVLVSGTGVTEDLEVTGCTFQSGTGSPTYAVSVPAGFVPNVHSNSGSQQDLDRTFTPTVKFGGANTGLTGSTFAGRYVRSGNRITGEFQIVLTAKGSSTGLATIEGLPKAAYSLSTNNAAGVNFAANMAALTQAPIGRIGANGTAIGLSEFNAAGTLDLSEANFTNTTILRGWFLYEVEG